ncbi:MAG: uroporphyrinogen decarboxylase [Candidatus Omnitrophica bacterium]|nr:uroporphyrinogen decarboxylase [Candidatus Omnitrophota bacterium]
MTITKSSGFKDLTVVSFESRQAEAMAKMIENEGARAISAPTMQEIPLEKNPEVFRFADRLLAGEVDVVIFMTGVGARYLMQVLETRFSQKEIVTALAKTMVVARGPKSVKVLKEFKIPVTILVPEPNTWREILEELDQNERSVSLKGKTVAVQEYGTPNQELLEGLKSRGAKVIRVPVYRWALPDDLAPLQSAIQAIIDGKVQVALFTNAMQVEHLLQVAAERGLESKLRSVMKNIFIASIGPTCSEAIIEKGFQVNLEPQHSTMGALIKETAEGISKRKKNSEFRIPNVEKHGSTFDIRHSTFMKACRREPVERTPIWLMRQAGRYMKEYRDVRNKVSFLDLCKNPELVAEVTVTAQEKIAADAAILFADILLIVEPLGLELGYDSGEGPVISGVKTVSDLKQLREIEPFESLSYVFDAVRWARQALKPDIPLIGFSGAPFTLASYIIEGGTSRNFEKTKALMYSDPETWRILLEKISRGLVKYINGQIEAGAQAIQIFDSWVGALGPDNYRDFVAAHSRSLIEGIKKAHPETPVIHFGTGNPELLEPMTKAGGDVIGVDFRVELDAAWKRIGYDRGIMGNLDPLVLYADRAAIKKYAEKILRQAAGRPGHIFNLGHGILPKTPVENVQYLVEIVHDFKI